MPLECVIEMFNSLLVLPNQSEVFREDLVDTLNSFYFDTDKISLNSIPKHIMNYEQLTMPQRKAQIA